MYFRTAVKVQQPESNRKDVRNASALLIGSGMKARVACELGRGIIRELVTGCQQGVCEGDINWAVTLIGGAQHKTFSKCAYHVKQRIRGVVVHAGFRECGRTID